VDKVCANAILDAVEMFDSSLIILSQPDELISSAKKRGFKTATIIFADRAYNDSGLIVPRSEPNSVLDDPKIIIQRCVDMVVKREVKTNTGKTIKVKGNSLLLHGDTKGSLDLSKKIR